MREKRKNRMKYAASFGVFVHRDAVPIRADVRDRAAKQFAEAGAGIR